MSPLRNRTKVWIVTGAAAAALLTAAGVAAAATGSSAGAGGSTAAATTAAGSAASSASGPGTAPDPATVAHGPNETLLTGTTAAKVKAAAEAAVPGATVIRVETDSDGAAYEAHMKKADGSYVTVKLDKSFAVTSTIDGFGGPGKGAGQPRGATPSSSGTA